MRNKAGFTLVELLVVVVIISILSAVAVPTYARFISDAKMVEAFNVLQPLIRYAQSYIRGHPADWSQPGMLLGADARGTSYGGGGRPADDWVSRVVGQYNKYFDYDYDYDPNVGCSIRAWGKEYPFSEYRTFYATAANGGDYVIARLDNAGNVTWEGGGKLQGMTPGR